MDSHEAAVTISRILYGREKMTRWKWNKLFYEQQEIYQENIIRKGVWNATTGEVEVE